MKLPRLPRAHRAGQSIRPRRASNIDSSRHGWRYRKRPEYDGDGSTVDSRAFSWHYLPPKSLLNDLNTRLGKSPVLEGTFGPRCAKGHCEPPWTWQAPVGILVTGRSMS